MEALIAKIREIVEAALPGAVVEDLRPTFSGERVAGSVVWDGFRGVDHLERQERLWAALRDRLDREERRRIALIGAFTPEEIVALQED